MTGVQDRVIIVTGAGGGLGRAPRREYALLLARHRARVDGSVPGTHTFG